MPKHLYNSCMVLLAALECASNLAGQGSAATATVLEPRTAALLNKISPEELKGDLSFLASDALAGRFTPSPGLEAAAAFIASKFRLFGLEPGGNQEYFQIAHMVDRRASSIEVAMQVKSGPRTMEIPLDQLEIRNVDRAADLAHIPLIVFSNPDLEALKKANVNGKAVVQAAPAFGKLSHEQAMAAYHRMRAFSVAAAQAGAALELVVSSSRMAAPPARLIEEDEARTARTPIVLVSSPEFRQWFESAGGASENSVSLKIPAPVDREVVVKNVVGILRGSDPNLKATCVLLTAHYDHIGTLETGRAMSTPAKAKTSDTIYNGANDDGSGTVSVLEIARALSGVHPRPRRSIVFMTFFGEERGELGSQFYTTHPVFPIGKTVADVNLEQVGRTDSTVGPQINTASLTGYDYSDVTKFVAQAGRLTGIKVYKDNQASDAYFTQSDNSPLAEAGIPAHSLTVAFDYSDYHGLGDEWQKVDYDNMARVDRMVALAVLDIANNAKAPAWNAQNSKTKPFRDAQAKEASQ